MSNDERKIRLSIARDIINKVYDDLCSETTDVISRETTMELCDIIIKLNEFSSNLN